MLLVLVAHQTRNSLLAFEHKRQEKPPKHSPVLPSSNPTGPYTHYWYSHVQNKHTPDKVQQLPYYRCSYDQILSDVVMTARWTTAVISRSAFTSLSQDVMGFLVDWLCYCFRTPNNNFIITTKANTCVDTPGRTKPLYGHPSLHCDGYRFPFLAVKRPECGIDYQLPSSADLKDQSYKSTPHLGILACSMLKCTYYRHTLRERTG